VGANNSSRKSLRVETFRLSGGKWKFSPCQNLNTSGHEKLFTPPFNRPEN
jgi:hypothetical protein